MNLGWFQKLVVEIFMCIWIICMRIKMYICYKCNFVFCKLFGKITQVDLLINLKLEVNTNIIIITTLILPSDCKKSANSFCKNHEKFYFTWLGKLIIILKFKIIIIYHSQKPKWADCPKPESSSHTIFYIIFVFIIIHVKFRFIIQIIMAVIVLLFLIKYKETNTTWYNIYKMFSKSKRND